MTHKHNGDELDAEEESIHQYYMDIINCMPNIVYWVDSDCNLKGCNQNFIKLLGIKSPRELHGTPYDHLLKYAHWSPERIDKLRLEDMSVIFSGQPQHNILEFPVTTSSTKVSPNYLVTRIPLFNKQKQIRYLVVIFIEIPPEKSETMHVAEISATYRPLAEIITPHVLLVEDNEIAQKVEKAILESIGCKVALAASGREALELFEPGKFHVVLMDIGLQDTSGYVVAKNLREQEQGTDFQVPIIALTSYDAKIIRDDCSDYFMEGVVTKPISSEQAIQIVHRYVYKQDIEVSGLLVGAKK